MHIGLSDTEQRVTVARNAAPFASGREIARRTGLSDEAVSRIQHRVADRTTLPTPDDIAAKQRRAAELALDRLIEALSGKAPQRNARSWPAIQLKYVELALRLVGSQSIPAVTDPAVVVQNIRAMVFGQPNDSAPSQRALSSANGEDGPEVSQESSGAGQEPDGEAGNAE